MNIYQENSNKGKMIVDHLKRVELRGRKKIAFG
jgi:hypothetical protein